MVGPEQAARFAALVHLDEVLTAIAPVLAQYHATLVQSGFSPENAILLVRDAQRSMLGQYSEEMRGDADAPRPDR